MANRVIHFEIQADDIDRAKTFYERTFDWKVEKFKTDDKNIMEYWGVTTGPDETPGINGGMYMRPADRKIFTFDCTILVENIDRAIEDVKQNGGVIRMEKMELKGVGFFAGCTDTEGNAFALMQSTDWKPH